MTRVAGFILATLALPVAAAPGDVRPWPAATGDAKDVIPKEPTDLTSLREAFADLDDPDAIVREAARVRLMGMRRRDLPAFHDLVRDSRPLTPAQSTVLRQIVIHVYLAGEPYKTTGVQGFLGVRMQDTSVRLPGAAGSDPSAPDRGVVIVERMPGFIGARMLLDGDVILGIEGRPDARMLSTLEFSAVIQSYPPGDTVRFQIVRQGQVITLPITLDKRPFESEPFILQELLMQRLTKAEDYWNESFADLVKESVG